MEEAMKEVKMVVEGVYSAKAAMELSAKYDVSMPIIEQVNEVLFDGKSAKEAVMDLMLRIYRIYNYNNSEYYWRHFSRNPFWKTCVSCVIENPPFEKRYRVYDFSSFCRNYGSYFWMHFLCNFSV